MNMGFIGTLAWLYNAGGGTMWCVQGAGTNNRLWDNVSLELTAIPLNIPICGKPESPLPLQAYNRPVPGNFLVGYIAIP